MCAQDDRLRPAFSFPGLDVDMSESGRFRSCLCGGFGLGCKGHFAVNYLLNDLTVQWVSLDDIYIWAIVP